MSSDHRCFLDLSRGAPKKAGMGKSPVYKSPGQHYCGVALISLTQSSTLAPWQLCLYSRDLYQ